MATLTLVVNPSAGRGRTKALLPLVIAEFVNRLPQDRLQLVQPNGYHEAGQAVRAAVEEADPGDKVVVMGGDGMMHQGVNACAGTDIALGLIPSGTGNDMCRGFGLPHTNPINAARIISTGHIAQVDLIETGLADESVRFVGSVIASGFDALVNERANAMRRPKGNLRYAVAALAELSTFAPLAYTMTTDRGTEKLPAMLVAVGNGGYFGGGMRICPDADAFDGLLDLTIVHPVGRLTLLRLLPQLFTGGFAKHPAVEQRTTTAVTLDVVGGTVMGDGESLGAPPFTATCRPGVLRIFAPAGPDRTKP